VALAQDGKSGIKRVEQAIRLAPSLASQDGQAAMTKGMGGRQAAMQHRKVRALIGTGNATQAAARPSAHLRVRPVAMETAPKVGDSPTPPGNAVTQTMVERSRKVTGNESGSCRMVTGAEYIGFEQSGRVCGSQVGSVPMKVRLNQAARDVTGDEPGSCNRVTGSQYLSAEHFKTFCRSEVPVPMHRVSVMSTPAGQILTGSAIGRSDQVTGDEAGSCRAVTGSQYFNAKDFGALCNAGGPRKVATIETRGGAGASGTETASSLKMSGDAAGRCSRVTGTDYVSAGQSAARCGTNAPQIDYVGKVVTDLTIGGGRVTGSAVGRSKPVTGDERGACAPVSGSSYIGQEQYKLFCAPDDWQAQSARSRDRASIPATMISGDRPGAGGMAMTGDERGACVAVTGVPYIGPDTMAPTCRAQPETSNRFLFRQPPPAPDKPAAPANFSIQSPARVAWDANRETRAATGAVTGTAYGAADRITGPGNKARGLITGTPEFRHHEAAPVPRINDQRSGQIANNAAKVAKTQRLSGEAQIHRRVTGDAWQAQSRVSGTEGRSSVVRNPSQRGSPRGSLMDARIRPDIEKPPAATNLVTGSSGNTGRGPFVTVSGGARA
jgi:hypothetical protein